MKYLLPFFCLLGIACGKLSNSSIVKSNPPIEQKKIRSPQVASTPIPMFVKGQETVFISKTGETLFTLPKGHSVVVNPSGWGHHMVEHLRPLEVFDNGIATVKYFQEGYYWINTKGEKIKSFKEEDYRVNRMSDGLYLAKYITDTEFRHFYLNPKGENIFGDKTFNTATNFKNGLAFVKEESTSKGQFINKKGKVIYEVAFEDFPPECIKDGKPLGENLYQLAVKPKVKGTNRHNYEHFPVVVNGAGETIFDARGEDFSLATYRGSRFNEGVGGHQFCSENGAGPYRIEFRTVTGDPILSAANIMSSQYHPMINGTGYFVQRKEKGLETTHYLFDRQGKQRELVFSPNRIIEKILQFDEIIIAKVKLDNGESGEGLYRLSDLKELFVDEGTIHAYDETHVIVYYKEENRLALKTMDGTLVWETPVELQIFHSLDRALLHHDKVKHYVLELPGEFSNGLVKLRNLERLDIKKMLGTFLPKEIGQLKNVEKITISRAYNLKSLPKELAELPNLKKLEIDYCKELKEGLEYLVEHSTSLKELKITNSALSEDFKRKMYSGNTMISFTQSKNTMY